MNVWYAGVALFSSSLRASLLLIILFPNGPGPANAGLAMHETLYIVYALIPDSLLTPLRFEVLRRSHPDTPKLVPVGVKVRED